MVLSKGAQNIIITYISNKILITNMLIVILARNKILEDITPIIKAINKIVTSENENLSLQSIAATIRKASKKLI